VREAYCRRVRTLHTAYRVTDLATSLGFYTALGYDEVGRVDLGDGVCLVILKFPGEEVGALELVHRPADDPVDVGTGFSHLVVQVDDLAATIEALSRAGLSPGPVERPGGTAGPQTSWLTDPDGYRIELVQWPPGHPDGITAADFGDPGRAQFRGTPGPHHSGAEPPGSGPAGAAHRHRGASSQGCSARGE
jgi:lactoylglutathione lyase